MMWELGFTVHVVVMAARGLLLCCWEEPQRSWLEANAKHLFELVELPGRVMVAVLASIVSMVLGSVRICED